jgi:hypothetical protein
MRRAEFEADFCAALGQAGDTFHVAAVPGVIDRWQAQALLCANLEIQAGADADRR